MEYFVRSHGVPINSAFYVWSLSLFMATAASFVFLRIHGNGRLLPAEISASTAIWTVCITGCIGLAAVGAAVGFISPGRLPACFALIFGLGFALHGLAEHRPLLCALGIVWWLGASVLFRTTLPEAFLFFGFLLTGLIALPVTLTAIRVRRSAANHE